MKQIDFEQELYSHFGQVKDFTLGMRIAKRFYDMGKNSQEPVSDDFKLFEKEYLEKEEDEILCVYDRHAGLVDGAQWQKLQMIEKACKWLDENAAKYLIDKSVHGVKMTGLDTSFTEDFKKAMKA